MSNQVLQECPRCGRFLPFSDYLDNGQYRVRCFNCRSVRNKQVHRKDRRKAQQRREAQNHD